MPKPTRTEMIAMVEKIMGVQISEAERAELISELSKHFIDPNWWGVIYYPDGEEFTAEQVVDKALEYRPIQL